MAGEIRVIIGQTKSAVMLLNAFPKLRLDGGLGVMLSSGSNADTVTVDMRDHLCAFLSKAGVQYPDRVIMRMIPRDFDYCNVRVGTRYRINMTVDDNGYDESNYRESIEMFAEDDWIVATDD